MVPFAVVVFLILFFGTLTLALGYSLAMVRQEKRDELFQARRVNALNYAVNRLREIGDSKETTEVTIARADGVLVALLMQIGYERVVDKYEQVTRRLENA